MYLKFLIFIPNQSKRKKEEQGTFIEFLDYGEEQKIEGVVAFWVASVTTDFVSLVFKRYLEWQYYKVPSKNKSQTNKIKSSFKN